MSTSRPVSHVWHRPRAFPACTLLSSLPWWHHRPGAIWSPLRHPQLSQLRQQRQTFTHRHSSIECDLINPGSPGGRERLVNCQQIRAQGVNLPLRRTHWWQLRLQWSNLGADVVGIAYQNSLVVSNEPMGTCTWMRSLAPEWPSQVA